MKYRVPLFLVVWSLAISAWADTTLSGRVTIHDPQDRPILQSSPVVVFIEGADDASRKSLRESPVPKGQPQISHRDRQFSPRVLPLTAGTRVDFRNDDGIFHNAFSLSRAKPFDLGIYPQGTAKFVDFDEPGLVRVYCNLHPEMVGNILVLDNGYFTQTDPDGHYTLRGIPGGQFLLRTWSEQADARERPVTIAAGGTQTIDFVLKARRQFGKHTNKFGKPYRNKY